MNNRLGISTGVFHKHYKSEQLNEVIGLISNLSIDFVEVLFARPFMLDIEISPNNLLFLKSKKVIIHAPFFGDEGYKDISYDSTQLEKIVKKAELLNAEWVVIHPNQIQDMDLLLKYRFCFGIENQKEKAGFLLSDFPNFLTKYPHFKVVVDLGHAAKLGVGVISKLIKQLEEKIIEIQFSVDDNYRSILTETVSEEMFTVLKEHNFPIILESRPENIEDLPEIINKIRTLLKKND